MSAPNIHPSSAVGANVVVAPSARIGPNCYIDGHTRIGENTMFVGGVTFVGDADIGENCVIEPGVSVTTVPSTTTTVGGRIIVGPRTHIGAGSVLARGVHIGSDVRIAVGAFVSRNVPSHAVVSGNPAGIVGYDTAGGAMPDDLKGEPRAGSVRTSAVEGVRFYTYPIISDARGDLSVGEFGPDFPFQPKRYFVVFNVPSAAHRGEHAHWECEEMLICLRGSVVVVVDDGTRREEIELNDPNVGLYLAPMVWRVQYRYSRSCIVLVLASSYYEPKDYIRDYDRFLVERSKRSA